MNGHWNFYCAFNSNGTSRGKSHSTKSFRLAFRRIYVILHGGDVATMNARFANWGVRKLQSDRLTLPENAYPTLKVFWNPQGFGSPDIAANSADAYYPGDDYVDVVGDDIYDQGGRYEHDAMVDLYRAHPGKPFAIGEFGLWNLDHPQFIQRHRDVRQDTPAHRARGLQPGGVRIDLRSREQVQKPRSLQALPDAARELAADLHGADA